MNNTGKKYGGRTKNTPNKITSEVRSKISKILDNNINQVEQDLKQLQPKDRLNILLQLMKFIIPTLKQVEVEHQEQEHNFTPIIIDFSNEKR